ncbi:fumarylacetoacetate hydrolase family protein [Pseudarthrobacter raffinosi]|uniref:fumarylacetoacetate hydrolase family protein n=1 Tax=Pseudarthrobacter raffinosi TaxID=2953651 RepID=UPI00208E55EE|nr:fumarylacetoacetate hydrolase family protein [Pseudarthrobacter sp. MDT3-9]MCO4252144.1 fumarylacetoacetate hydrolase family protein [Pseudarthrobacter sp. MDT3-9]
MTRLVSTSVGVGRMYDGNTVDLLDIDFRDLGEALLGGCTVDQIATAPVRRRTTLSEVELLAPIPRPSKIWAVGFGYADHRAEVGHTSDNSEPMIFLKAPSSVIGTSKPIRFPRVAPNEVDYEGELGVVIGRRLSEVTEEQALAGIAGYTICNDVSARDVQKGRVPGRPADVSTAKSFDTFTPMGPYLVTLDELPDPDDLRLRTWVDDELRQDARTSDLIYPVSKIVSYLSQQTTLEPGDVVLTGTPAGVGHKQGKFLRPGQSVRIAIDGVGELVNTCQ